MNHLVGKYAVRSVRRFCDAARGWYYGIVHKPHAFQYGGVCRNPAMVAYVDASGLVHFHTIGKQFVTVAVNHRHVPAQQHVAPESLLLLARKEQPRVGAEIIAQLHPARNVYVEHRADIGAALANETTIIVKPQQASHPVVHTPKALIYAKAQRPEFWTALYTASVQIAHKHIWSNDYRKPKSREERENLEINNKGVFYPSRF